MRIDKFLKLSRLVKRRTVAQEMTDVGAVLLNSKRVKPSAEVKVGDRLSVAFPGRVITAEILNVDEIALKRGADSLLMIEERRLKQEELPW